MSLFASEKLYLWNMLEHEATNLEAPASPSPPATVGGRRGAALCTGKLYGAVNPPPVRS